MYTPKEWRYMIRCLLKWNLDNQNYSWSHIWKNSEESEGLKIGMDNEGRIIITQAGSSHFEFIKGLKLIFNSLTIDVAYTRHHQSPWTFCYRVYIFFLLTIKKLWYSVALLCCPLVFCKPILTIKEQKPITISKEVISIWISECSLTIGY